ncbi:DeoR/GlpR family DNA-binding transcription regulator [Ferdinandcohnia quinoae]|uniref:DeoR/GlpR family DNA-binding transcription regulator n=1 Tax=Fredinandcohnia quinoae TaxID=2918902 RepID=A0AAW5E7E4_9BACI|nr:DeoR/GlpR family DNA-binding transcription regulator [Fredinandcohnia sp. SECRCQ15]MCH1625926.1 DeoR/GlpR family DNA-binding transcription regulator [Fredinandcohnia sp. SECRCQ15]
MLTPERHQIIVDLLKQKGVVKLQELVERTDSSESTIRRDLMQLEEANKLKRVHGGAELIQGKRSEPSYQEKSAKNLQQKEMIAKYAASLVNDGDSIFLDAGSTTMQMIPYLNQKDITVVTNGVNLIEELLEKEITTYLIGGMVKKRTKALIGSGAITGLKGYRFDKCFIGVNGIDLHYGYTTPDPEEALLKQTAMSLSREKYIVADHSKFGEVSFAKIAELQEAVIITDKVINKYSEYTKIKVVTS